MAQRKTRYQKGRKKVRPAPLNAPPAAISGTGCGLCGAGGRLTLTECCGQPICDDEHKYRLFSFARNSCSRNHRRFTVCGHHHAEHHTGSWQDCSICAGEIETELYVHYGTNEYNFVKLKNPPKFKPTHCCHCKAIIDLAAGGYSMSKDGYSCTRCMLTANPNLAKMLR